VSVLGLPLPLVTVSRRSERWNSHIDASKKFGDVDVNDTIPLLDSPVGVVLYPISLSNPSVFLVFSMGIAEEAYQEGFMGFH